jgi:uncharacterized protein YndB with AHSA1/START domain
VITGIDLLMRRSYPAPAEWIWKMWTTPEGVAAWWLRDPFGRSRKEFTELEEPTRLAYHSVIDFVPDVEPYRHRTVVSLERTASGTDVEMWIDPLHDREWTERIVAGRTAELDNLERVLSLLSDRRR